MSPRAARQILIVALIAYFLLIVVALYCTSPGIPI